jgi:hypothetical protein
MKLLVHFFLVIIIMGCNTQNSKELPLKYIQDTVPQQCQQSYMKVIFDDMNRGRYLLGVSAEYQNDEFDIVLDSYELSKYLDASGQGHDSVTIQRVLTGKENIKLDSQNINEVAIVKTWKSIDDIVKNGRDFTIEYFFYNEMQKDFLSNSERDYLIYKLNEWCLITLIDDESGNLQIRTPEFLNSIKRPVE